jgi:hypothetical protein
VTVAAEKTLTGITIELLPPTSDASIAPTQEAPVDQDRSFFDTARHLDDYLGTDSRPRIPVNPDTGLAFPIILPANRRGDETTRHHHNFPDSYLGGHALRHVYIQNVYARLHNRGPQAIHSRFSIPEGLPENPQDLLGTFTMGLALHLPTFGMDLLSGKPEVRKMSDMEWKRLRKPAIWGLDGMQHDIDGIPARHKLWACVDRRLPEGGEVSQVHHYISQILLEGVRFTSNYGSRSQEYAENGDVAMGFDLLREAAEIVTETNEFRGRSLSSHYNRLRKGGSLREDSPEKCGDLLIGAMGTRGKLGMVLTDLKLQIMLGSDEAVA